MPKDKAKVDSTGRSGGGDSGGGAYPNPHTGKQPKKGGFMSTGGKSEMGYEGGDNPNATTQQED